SLRSFLREDVTRERRVYPGEVSDGPAPEQSSSGVVARRHDPSQLRLALAALFVAILSLALPLTIASAWAALASVVAVLGATVVSVWLVKGKRLAAEGGVTADADGIHAGGARVLARLEVAYGFVEPSAGGALVKLLDASHGLRL